MNFLQGLTVLLCMAFVMGAMQDHKDCESCVDDGWGWCPIRRVCGGFQNKQCPDDERAYAEDHPRAQEILAEKEAEKAEEAKGPVVVLTEDNFDSIVLDESKHVLVDFYAPWCGHCKTLDPILTEVAEVFVREEEVVVAKCDATTETALGRKYGVKSFPTIKMFPKDQKYGIDYAGSGRTKEAFVDYLNDKAGTKRKADGTLKPDTGLVKPLDRFVMALEDDDQVDLTKLSEIVAQAAAKFPSDHPQAKGASIYASIMADMAKSSDGVGFIGDDMDRIETVLQATEGIEAATIKDLEIRSIILKKFKTIKRMSAADMKAYAKANKLDTTNVVEKSDLRKVIKKSIAMGADRLAIGESIMAGIDAQLAEEEAKREAKRLRQEESKRKEAERKEKRRLEKEAEANSKVVTLKDYTFKKIVLDREKDVLVEFYAPWCGHCKELAPTYEEVAVALSDKEDIVIAKLDATVHRSSAQAYEVQSYPTIKYFPKTNKKGIDYTGGRDKESFIEHMTAGYDGPSDEEPEPEAEEDDDEDADAGDDDLGDLSNLDLDGNPLDSNTGDATTGDATTGDAGDDDLDDLDWGLGNDEL